MADINISVGIKQEQSVNDFKTLVETLVRDLRREAKDINVSFDTGSINKVKTQIYDIQKEISKIDNKKINLSLDSDFKNGIQKTVSSLNISINNLDKNVNELSSSIKNIGNSTNPFGNIDKSIVEATNLMQGMESQVTSLKEAMKSFSGINIGLSVGGKSGISSVNYRKATNDAIKELKNQAEEIGKIFQQRYNSADYYNAVAQSTLGTNAWNKADIQGIMSATLDNTISKIAQVDAWKDYIELMKGLAKVNNIDISGATSKFSKSAEEIRSSVYRIADGTDELEDNYKQLKSIFGNDVDLSGVIQKLDEVKIAIQEINKAITETPKGESKLTTLSSSIDKITVSVDTLREALEQVGTITTNFNNDINSSIQPDGIVKTKESVQELVSEVQRYNAKTGNITNLTQTYRDSISGDIRTESTSYSKKGKVTSQYIDIKSTATDEISKLTQYYSVLNQCENALNKYAIAENSSNQVASDMIVSMREQVTNMRELVSGYQKGTMSAKQWDDATKSAKLNLAQFNDTMKHSVNLQELNNLQKNTKNSSSQTYVSSEYSKVASSYNSLIKSLNGDNNYSAVLDTVREKFNQVEQSVNQLKTSSVAATKEQISETLTHINVLQKYIDEVNKLKNAQITGDKISKQTVMSTYVNPTYGSIKSKYNSLNNSLGGQGASDTDKSELKELTVLMETLNSKILTLQKSSDIVTQNEVSNVQKQMSAIQELISKIEERKKAEKENIPASEVSRNKYMKQYISILTEAESATERFSSAQRSSNSNSRSAYQGYKNLANGIKENISSQKTANWTTKQWESEISNVRKQMAGYTQIIKENGDATRSMTSRLHLAISKFASWLTASQGVMYAVQSIRKMVSATIELDSAMTELKKVTDASDGTYAQFLDNASSRTEQLGASLSDVVNSTADFARLGYGIQEAASLSDAATIYKNVGDGIESIDEASQSIISTMQAFGVQADDAMSIVDKFNEVGKVMPNSTVMC